VIKWNEKAGSRFQETSEVLGLNMKKESGARMKRTDRFKDKVVWITGASSGIGESLARKFDERGARLILSPLDV
jgi:3-oxoacyl-ACP reductase-like protein